MKEFKKGFSNGHFHTNSKEFSESTTKNFASTIYSDEIRNSLILTKKFCTTYKYRIQQEIVNFFVSIISHSLLILYSTRVFQVYFRVKKKRSSRITHCKILHLSLLLDCFPPMHLITMQSSLNVLAFCPILSNWFTAIHWPSKKVYELNTNYLSKSVLKCTTHA
jgi:hypothetical protein